ncbi:MarR family winged helix-turn-helix transcriptional regulator [Kutzneria kofuensis]|uniref:DNA-binding MarR family transcriptional regulator n=1 Tax=Kutzneria kofuensis TaxID=103725 RepID=A0A7W9KRR4_9PSEU|nr:MarR family transcriptional regulator [Kutzneria kofuensis]MBB5897417.1 DNA-binding MarR family transcriptional regulator [Kutzneria kofuensis]
MRDQSISLALRRMLQAGREMQSAVARRMGVRITDVQAVDHVVSADEPLGPVELGSRLGIRSASATALVDRLVAAGHLRREPDPHDRRRVVLHATDHARGDVHAALSPLLTEIDTIVGNLSPAEATTVLAFLTDVTAAMRAYANPGESRSASHRM